ncbi:MAG: ABC transporter ATP-binding protein [Oculatellaceae cyanobacterium Prado106]|jgi:NitT/TauT family transport system ATP-binding protein|nr:ABC transporter ATP-binding protein [Oculatellaceae cyanobacterium Prado106]
MNAVETHLIGSENARDIIIEQAHCTFRLGSGREVKALRDINLTIPAGQFVCLVGGSGHGKSTLLRSLAGLNPLTGGQIRVGTHSITRPSPEMGMVFQEDTVFPWMKVQANVEFGLRAKKLPAQKCAQIAKGWLEVVGLGDCRDAWPKELSGGMRKRVAIATAFALGADIFLMDEPFGALDYVTRLGLQRLLLDLWQQTQKTIVFVTHDIEEALILADRIVVLKQGSVVDDLPIRLTRPRTEEVRASSEALTITKTIMSHLGLDEVNQPSKPSAVSPLNLLR